MILSRLQNTERWTLWSEFMGVAGSNHLRAAIDDETIAEQNWLVGVRSSTALVTSILFWAIDIVVTHHERKRPRISRMPDSGHLLRRHSSFRSSEPGDCRTVLHFTPGRR